MHEHSGCEHELKHCSCCNVVYCTKCKQEWGRAVRYWPWPYYQQMWIGGSLTADDLTSTTITYTCDHT